MEDNRRAQLRLMAAREKSNHLGNEVGSLEARIAALALELENKKSVLRCAKEEVEEMNVRINYNLEKRDGLCIRYVH